MTDAGGSPLPPNANINALVEAIDARARQAGSDGAATLLRGMIGSVSEVLASIQDRLDRMEDLLAEGAGGSAGGATGGALAEQVQAGLATFNARLGRLEEAFVQAVEDSGSGTDAVVDQLRRTIVEAISEHQPPPAPPAPPPVDLGPQLEEVMNPIRARLTGLEQLIRARGEERTDPVAPIRAALAPIAERLDGLEIAVRSANDTNSERIARIDAATAPLATQVAALAAAPKEEQEDRPPLLDPELVARLEATIEQLGRDEATAKVVALVEERVGAGVQAVVERSEATGRAVDALGEAQAELRRRVDDVARAVEAAATGQQRMAEDTAEAANQRLGGRFSTLGDRISGLDARLDTIVARLTDAEPPAAAVDHTETLQRIEQALAKPPPVDHSETLQRIEQAVAKLADAADDITTRLTALEERPPPPPPPPPPPAPQPVDDQRVVDTVRREAEMLTQRVAALAVGVEAARALLQQHVEETENSLGKKASVVTRKLAADFGLGNRRGRGGGRDRRQLGTGDGDRDR